MKKKVMAVVFVLAMLISTSAFAVDFSDGWTGCTPMTIGPNNGDVMVKLNCTSQSGWARLSTAGTDQMLATFLTAMSLGKSVSVNFSGTVTETGGTFLYSRVVGVQMSK